MILEIQTKTLPQLFEQAAHETTRTALPNPTIAAVLREKLSTEGANPSILMSNWLTLVLQVLSKDRMAFVKFDIRQLGPRDGVWRLQAEVTGELMESTPNFHPLTLHCVSAEVSGDEHMCRAHVTLEAPVSNGQPAPLRS
jgi:SHS2 domain-containing protein